MSQQCNLLNQSEIFRIPTRYNSLNNSRTSCILKDSEGLGYSGTICVPKYYVQWSEITQFFPCKIFAHIFSIQCGVCGGESNMFFSAYFIFPCQYHSTTAVHFYVISLSPMLCILSINSRGNTNTCLCYSSIISINVSLNNINPLVF
jgi:hypothetical protein